MATSKEHIVGEMIEGVDILGELSDRLNPERVVEADVMLTLQRLGRCMLTVVTKDHYENMILSRHTYDVNQLDSGEIDFNDEEDVPPYVVNEDDITDDLLNGKFLHHSVWPGLAGSIDIQE